MLKKIILSFLFLSSFSSLAFASSATLSVDNEKIDINNPLNLQISIQSDWWWDLEIKKVQWLENFDVVWKSQSQSSSSQIQIINWKTEAKTSVNHILSLSLQAKQKWDFEIWPAIISTWSWEIKTNTVKVNVSWWKILMNSNSIKNNQFVQKNIPQVQKIKKEKIQDFESAEKKDFWNNDSLYLFLWILILLWWGAYFYYKDNPDELEKILEKIFNKKSFGEKEKIEEIKEDFIDFEEEKEEKFPDLNDEKFLEKINKIFLKKLSKKFQIKKIETKTNDEILKEISESEQENIKNIFKFISKAKYSNIIWDNSKIYDLIKNLK